MSPTSSVERLVETLPGTWMLGATSLLYWLDGRHGDPRFTMAVESEAPLQLTETIEFADPEGRPLVSRGASRLIRDEFVWRGAGREMLTVRRWTPVAVDGSGSLLVVRYRRSWGATSGLSILVRADTEINELRTLVASTADQLGLAPEDFATLTWLR